MEKFDGVFLKKIILIILIHSLVALPIFSQNTLRIPPPPCYANDNVGLGGAVGLNYFLRGGDATTITLNVIYYYGSGFNDVFVLYLDNGSPGRSVIDASVDDDADSYRIAITNSNAFGYGSTITFPAGFEATHAIAIDSNSGSLYSIPSTGNVGTGELNFIKSVTTNSQNTPYAITFDYSDIGLSAYGDFYFVGLYVGHDGYTSDEGYGDGITTGTQGSDDVVYTGYRSYQNDCNVTLGTINPSKDFIDAYFIDGNLKIKLPNEAVKIKVYDTTSRLILSSKHHINGEISVPLGLIKNQLYFIEIEGASSKKVLKVIPH